MALGGIALPEGGVGRQSAQPLPRVLELATSNVADSAACGRVQVAKNAVFGFLDAAAARKAADKEKLVKREQKLQAEAKSRKKNFFGGKKK